MRKVLLMLSFAFLCSTFYFVQGKSSELDGKPEQVKLSQSNAGQSDGQNPDDKFIKYQESFKMFRLIVYSIFGLLVLLIAIVWLFLIKGRLREYIIEKVLGSKRVAEKFKLNEHYQSNNIALTFNLTEKDIDTIVDRVIECKRLNEKENQQQRNTKTKEGSDQSKTVIKYLKGKSGKIFNRAESTPENSFFKLFNENNDIAQFAFCGDEAEAIAKRVFSEDICKIVSGNYQDAKSVKTNKPGKIKRIGEQWEVTEPIEIKLI